MRIRGIPSFLSKLWEECNLKLDSISCSRLARNLRNNLKTLLVLLNTEFDEAEYDCQEQYVIRVLSVIPDCSPLEAPNLEQDLSDPWNCNSQGVGFYGGQFNLSTIWQILQDDATEKPMESLRTNSTA